MSEQDDRRSGLVALLFAPVIARVTPWFVRIGAYLGIAAGVAGYGWWAWKRAQKLDAAGVEPPPAPPPTPPGPVPRASLRPHRQRSRT